MTPILFSIENSIAFITLNRPEKFNSFNRPMALLLQETLDACAIDDNIRCVFITGTGKAFCAGQDLEEVTDPDGPGMDKILSEQFNPIILKIHQLQKPVMAAVNGVAAGAGANIALACDIVVAAEGASFIQAFSKIGLIPDSGGTYQLPRLIGWQKASAIMMLGDRVNANEAEKMGMIYKYFSNESFKEESIKIARTLASLPTQALALTKNSLQLSAGNNLEEQLKAEDILQQKAAGTEDFQEGVNAFLEKRQALFTGK